MPTTGRYTTVSQNIQDSLYVIKSNLGLVITLNMIEALASFEKVEEGKKGPLFNDKGTLII